MTTLANQDVVIWYAMRESWHLRPVLEHNFTVYHGRTVPQQVQHSKHFRVVVVSWWLQQPDPLIPDLTDLSWADLVICVNPETVPPSGQTWSETQKLAQTQFGNDHCVVISGGTHLDQINEDLYPEFNFFFWEVMRGNRGRLPVWDFKKPRPYWLEAMLGQARNNRSQFLSRLKSHRLLDTSLVNIYSSTHLGNENITYRSAALDQLETADTKNIFSPRPNHDPGSHVCDPIGPDSVWATCSIAPAIYQASWYSAVFETDDTSQILQDGRRTWTNFVTEKTAKVLYGSRIFVLFATPGRLAALRQQGFATFSDIIDESYDLVEDDQERFERAWCAIMSLQHRDPVALYQICQDRLQHNHDRFEQIIQQPDLIKWIQRCIVKYQHMAR